MEDGVGRTFFEMLRTPLGIISGGRGLKNIFAKADHPEDTEEMLKEELITILDEEEEKGAVNLFEKEMIKNVLKLYETKTKEIMIPRTSVFTVNIEDETSEIIDRIIEERYSRVPVYEKEIDNIIGVLHIKDLLEASRKGDLDNIDIRSLMRKPYFIHEYMSIDELFLQMKKLRNHMALVIDEYGGFSGIITIEDLVEEIVGDISDEDDDIIEEEEIVKINDEIYEIEGLTSISDINDMLNIDLPTDTNETIGGLLLATLGKIPDLSNPEDVKIAEFEHVNLEAIFVSDKRIEKLILRVKDRVENEA